jgi:putative ABC transport system permease protein
MIKNYLKIALRNIRRYPAHSILNIIGMAIGMACAILLLVIVQNDTSYDKFRKNADCLFRVYQRYHSDGKLIQTGYTPRAMAVALKEEYPEIIRYSRYFNVLNSFIKGDDAIEGRIAGVDKDYLEMFNLEFIRGSAKNALNGPYDIILTEEMAHKYFGSEDPMGKPMTVWPNVNFTVTGIIKKQPHNSFTNSLNSIISTDYLREKFPGNLDNWSNNNIVTLIELKKGTDNKWVEQKIKKIIQKNLKGSDAEIFLQNITRFHLEPINEGEANGYIIDKLCILIAFLFLLIACINFMNLSTAQSSRRAKEIAMRKVAGAGKRKIVFQFLGESLLLVFVAHVIAMILAELMLPGLNNILQNELAINYKSVGLYLGLISLVLFCGILAGSYPAFYLSSLKPLNIMKGDTTNNKGHTKLRRILVIAQFTLSCLLIICTLIVRSQINYLQNKNIGLDINNVCNFYFKGINQKSLKKDLKNNPDILSVSFTSNNPISIYENSTDVSWEGKNESDKVQFNIMTADEDYVNTFQIKIKEGRFFSSEFSTDATGAVINEKAAETLGFNDPIGKELSCNGSKLRIIGVLKDFHFQSLRFKISPLIITKISPDSTKCGCNIKIKPGCIPSTVRYIRSVIKSYHIEYPTNIEFLDFMNNKQFGLEQLIGTVLGYISLLAIIISCLGLVGLSTFVTLRRTKEIGIRKANGAKSNEIFSLLSKEYVSLVSISFILASPVAWYIMNRWLQTFAYNVGNSWLLYAVAWVIIIAITMLTVGFQSYKAASKNPVEALRYE